MWKSIEGKLGNLQYVEIKQPILNQWRNKKSQGKLENNQRLMKMETQNTKTYGMQQRQYAQGKFINVNAYIKKNE